MTTIRYEDDELTYGEHKNKETKSDIELLKEKYDSGDYICVLNNQRVKRFEILSKPFFNVEYENYKLIHKKHESVLMAYLDGKEIEYVRGTNIATGEKDFTIDKNFINEYYETAEYRIKESKLYCEDNKVKNSNVSHYDLWVGFEAIDLMKQVLTREEYIGYLKGNILKYQLRLGKKDNVEKELVKIKDYTNELNMILEIEKC